jgi:hypothetical protein
MLIFLNAQQALIDGPAADAAERGGTRRVTERCA